MLIGIVHTSGAVLARLSDPSISALNDMPSPPDACQWLELTQEQYDLLVVPFTDNRPAYRWTGADLELIEYRQWLAIVRKSDRAIMALDTDQGTLPDTLEYVAISKEDWGNVNHTLQLDNGKPAWACDVNGAVSAIPDPRPVLWVTLIGEPTTAAPVQADLQAKNAAGNNLNLNGPYPVIVVKDGVPKRVDLTFTNGAKSISQTLAAGTYEIRSADLSLYRVDGNAVFNVMEVEVW